MLDHSVAAAVLGGIERCVGGLDQVARLLCGIRLGAGDADADGDGLIEAGGVRHREVLDRRPHHLADLQRTACAGVRQQQAELLAAGKAYGTMSSAAAAGFLP